MKNVKAMKKPQSAFDRFVSWMKDCFELGASIGIVLAPVCFALAMIAGIGVVVLRYAFLTVAIGVLGGVLPNIRIGVSKNSDDGDNWKNGPGGSDWTGSDDIPEATAKRLPDLLSDQPEESRPWKKAA
jgi:hypothetical protein